MADGGTVAGGGGYSRYNWHAFVNVWITGNYDLYCTLHAEVGYWTQYAIQSNANASMWGAASGAWSGQMYATSQSGTSTVVISRDFTIHKGSSAQDVGIGGAVQVTGGFGNGYSSAEAHVTVPAISYRQPHPPSDPSVSRVSDSRADLTWRANYTGLNDLYPWTGIYVDRLTDEGQWVSVATLNWDALNYTDNGIAPNHRYRYGLRSYGPGGTSERVECSGSPVYTTPAAPSAVTLSKVTDTKVAVSIEGAAPYAESYDVEYSLNSGGWQGAGSTSAFPYEVDPGGGTVRFRVRAVLGDLASAWTESGEIATITPPLAPTVTVAGGASVVPTGDAITVSWAPNHPDGSAQAQAQVEVTVGDGAPQTSDVAGDSTSYTVPAQDSATTVRVRVRTKGLDPDWGAWSAPRAVSVAVPPTVSISSPSIDGGTVELLPYGLEWAATAPDGIASQTMTLSTGGRTVLSLNLPGDADGYSLSPETYMPENGTSYTLTVTVRAGSSLSAQAVRTFRVDYAGPDEASATVSYGAAADASLLVTAGTDPDHEQTETIDVLRVLPDGSQWTVATGLSGGQTAYDPLPPLNTDYSYLLIARSSTGTVSQATVPARVDAMLTALNFGPAAGTFEALRLDPSRSKSIAIATELYDFADGGEGDGLPVAYSTTAVSATGEEAATTLDVGQYRRLEAIARAHPMCWVRDVHGGRAYCACSWRFSAGVPYRSISCSVSLTETRWREAW